MVTTEFPTAKRLKIERLSLSDEAAPKTTKAAGTKRSREFSSLDNPPTGIKLNRTASSAALTISGPSSRDVPTRVRSSSRALRLLTTSLGSAPSATTTAINAPKAKATAQSKCLPHTSSLTVSKSPAKPPLHTSPVSPKGASEARKVAQVLKKLPPHYALLADMFGKLQNVYLLMRNRGQRCTFATVRQAVEAACGRRFTEKHLLQLKQVYPEALALQQVLSRPSTPGTPVRAATEPQLVLQMPLLDGEVGCNIAKTGNVEGRAQRTGVHDPEACCNEFAHRLMAILQDHCANHLKQKGIPHSQRPSPLQAAGKAGFHPEQAPEVVPAPLPQAPQLPGSAVKGSVALTPRTPVTTARTPSRLSTARRPPPAPTSGGARVSVRRLSFGGVDPDASLGSPAPPSATAALLRQESLDGSLPISMSAIKASEELAEARRLMCSPEAVSHSRQLHAVGASLRAFDIVRALFGRSGPFVLPRTQVHAELARNGACPEGDAGDVLDVLLTAAPNLLSLVESGDARGTLLRFSRQADVNAARAKVQRLNPRTRLAF